MRRTALLLIMALLCANPAWPQTDTAAIWRAFAERLDVGVAIKVRLATGRTFKATLVEARPDVLLVQRKTRLPVPIEPIAYDAIVSIEREKSGGISAGRAAAIGVATGAGAFLAILMILVASIQD